MARFTKRNVLLGALIVAGVVAVAWMTVRPSNERTWITQQTVLPAARIEGHLAHVQGVRNFHYIAEDRFTPAYYDRTYDLDKLVGASFILTPFSESWRGPAHTFVTFGFSDSQFVAISVEAPREPGETYGPLTGLFKQFELIYVIGDERDLIVNHVAPRRIPSGLKTILPGYSDEVAHELGLIDTDLDIARQYAQDSLFSLRIRETMTAPPGG